jgi:myo-inositol-1-phosphate synthase
MMRKIPVSIVGVGNLCSSLVQGLFSKGNGVLHHNLAGYKFSDIEIVSAIDIDSRKVGYDLAEAIFSEPNVALKFNLNVPKTNVIVKMGEILDGISEETKEDILVSSESCANLVEEFKKGVMVLCFLPSGAEEAVRFYAQKALEANCAFINATPSKLANDPEWNRKYENKNLPLIGDDIQDQMGATILHKLLLKSMKERGVIIDESYALDVGGGLESKNSLFRSRDLKREIKSRSVTAALDIEAPIIAGTSDYVEHMNNSRNTFIWIKGRYFNAAPIMIDMKITTEDGPNGGSVLLDVIRASYIALNQGSRGAVDPICAYGFKHPPGGITDPDVAMEDLARFILGTE